MMPTSDLNHTSMYRSHLEKKRHPLSFSHPLDGAKHYCCSLYPKTFATYFYLNAHPNQGKAVSAVSKSPAIEVSGSDIEP
ncbi:MAG: hypothetical protein ACYDHV_13625, partial [Desulfurivibrionaceae bacterium]